jgi:diacylglycerol kinase (ATP)
MKDFIIGRIKSFKYAFRGAWLLLTTEHSIIAQFFIACFLTVMGVYLSITKFEWMFQILTIGLVMGIEGINTAVEKTADFVHPDHHHKIGFIKDVAAGAVLIAGFVALIMVVMIYFPYFSNL